MRNQSKVILGSENEKLMGLMMSWQTGDRRVL